MASRAPDVPAAAPPRRRLPSRHPGGACRPATPAAPAVPPPRRRLPSRHPAPACSPAVPRHPASRLGTVPPPRGTSRLAAPAPLPPVPAQMRVLLTSGRPPQALVRILHRTRLWQRVLAARLWGTGSAGARAAARTGRARRPMRGTGARPGPPPVGLWAGFAFLQRSHLVSRGSARTGASRKRDAAAKFY